LTQSGHCSGGMEETSVSTARKSVSFSGSEWIYKDLPEPPFLVPHGDAQGNDKISEGDNDSEVEERRNSGSGENADGDGRNGRSAGRQSEEKQKNLHESAIRTAQQVPAAQAQQVTVLS